MPALRIPKEFERGFVLLKSLFDTDISRIVDALKDIRPTSDPSAAFPILRPALPQLQENDVRQLLEMLYSLYFYYSHRDDSLDEFIDDLSEAIEESENKDIRPSSASELDTLKGKLKLLLSIRSLSTVAKAHDLRTESANIFSEAKIISDIRPVWDGSVKEPPAGVVITQTLKLEYLDRQGTRELYIYLDDEDVESLMSVLLRAKEKNATIRSLATQNWMKILHE